MRLRIAHRVFAPRAWAALASVAMLAAFVSLGVWQVQRGHEKQALIEAFEHGQRSSVVVTAGASIDRLPQYQRVQVAGRYDSAHQVLLDNMPSREGRPGYRVLTPLVRPGAARILLVDRGWVPLGKTRAMLPEVDVAQDARTIAGRLDGLPQPGVRVGEPGVPGDRHWPRVLNFPRAQDLEQVLGTRLESRILLLDPDLPEGYERVWRPALGMGPERHLGYAVQWFALAAAVLVAFVALNLHDERDAG